MLVFNIFEAYLDITPQNSKISILLSFAIFVIVEKTSKSKNISSLSKEKIYFPFDDKTPILLEYSIPIFFLFVIIFILGSSFCSFFIIDNDLSLEQSFTRIISMSNKFWF